MKLHTQLNQLSQADAEDALLTCCASRAWVAKMLERRPFPTHDAAFTAAAEIWAGLSRSDILEAFAGHPKIGESLATLRERFAKTAAWSSQEQAHVVGANDELLEDLRQLNVAYEQRFGYIFIVCATGKNAQDMLELLKARMHHSADQELVVAAEEQAQITRIRLEKLCEVKS
jgi:2-oxo-4-hydroxy-4-carboxy-5-ureidoimidazoline decarboxylase